MDGPDERGPGRGPWKPNSYALNGQAGVPSHTRDRILHIADEIGWRPSIAALSLSGSRAHAVGLVIARTARTAGRRATPG